MNDPLGIENASSGVARRTPLNTASFDAKLGKQVGKTLRVMQSISGLERNYVFF